MLSRGRIEKGQRDQVRPFVPAIVPAFVFVVGAGILNVGALLEPRLIGSHALLYTDAARAVLDARDPWSVGPPAAIFAGPPSMLLPFLVLAGLPDMLLRLVGVVAAASASAWALRRCGLPAYWLAFPPLFESIVLGHPEPLVLAMVIAPSAMAGMAMLIKPYALLPLVARERWKAIVAGGIAAGLTLPFLPWAAFVDRLPDISANLARQSYGDSTYGSPILMGVALVALYAVGWRRGLWLVVPLLWPNAQPIYKVGSIPALSPFLATLWAIPIPGLTLLGIVGEAVLVMLDRRGALPPRAAAWLARPPEARDITDVRYRSHIREEAPDL